MIKLSPPAAAPAVVDRARFEEALRGQVMAEKEVTRHNDRVSASRRRLPMVQVEDYTFTDRDGPVTLTELFGDTYLLLVQNVMFDPTGTRAARAAPGRSTTFPPTCGGWATRASPSR